jgi:peptide/nickel transport system permease protein
MAALQPLDDAAERPPEAAGGLPPVAPAEAPPGGRAGARRRREGRGAVFADLLPVADPIEQFPFSGLDRMEPPSAEAPLGADSNGRDQLSRVVHGARVSLAVSLTAVSIGMVVGGVVGTAVGFVRGRIERVVMTVVDVMLAFPGLILLLVLLAYLERSLTVISMIIGFLSIPIYTRVARANTLAVAQREFVQAAVTLGARRSRILFREIIPNVALPLAAFGLVAMGLVIVLEGSLAYLGLSVQPPDPTWGGMIFSSKPHLQEAPHTALVPSAVMFLTVLSLNFVGDVLRRGFDVRDANL